MPRAGASPAAARARARSASEGSGSSLPWVSGSVRGARRGRPALAHPQHRQECFLRDLDRADPLHPLLALFLLLEQLALPGDVATVALGEDVLSHRADGFTRNH